MLFTQLPLFKFPPGRDISSDVWIEYEGGTDRVRAQGDRREKIGKKTGGGGGGAQLRPEIDQQKDFAA